MEEADEDPHGRNYVVGNGRFSMSDNVKHIQFDIWFDTSIKESLPGNDGLTTIDMPYSLVAKPNHDALTYVNNRIGTSYCIHSNNYKKMSVSAVFNNTIQELAANMTTNRVQDERTQIFVNHPGYYRVGSGTKDIFISNPHIFLLDTEGGFRITLLDREEVENLVPNKLRIIYRCPQEAEYSNDIGEAISQLNSVMKAGMDIFPTEVVIDFIYYLFDSSNKTHPEITDLLTLVVQSNNTNTGKGVLLKLMKTFMQPNFLQQHEDDTNLNLDIGLTRATLASSLQKGPVCMDEVKGSDKNIVSDGILSNWTNSVSLRTQLTRSTTSTFPFALSTNLDRVHLIKQLRIDDFSMDKVLFLNVGEKPWDKEKEVSQFMDEVKKLKKYKPVFLGLALSTRIHHSPILEDNRVQNTRIKKWITRRRSFYSGLQRIIEEEGITAPVWIAEDSYEFLTVPGLNCPDKPKTLKDFLIHVNKMTDEEFLNLRSFIVKGPRRGRTPLNIRILESDMKKSAVYKIFSTALSRLIIVKGNPIKMFARRNSMIINDEEEYHEEFVKVYCRILLTSSQVGYGNKDGQEWEDGDPVEGQIGNDDQLTAAASSPPTLQDGNRETPESDDAGSVEEEVEFGRKEGQVGEDGDPTEDKDFIDENLIDEASIHGDYIAEHRSNEDEIDDPREDENTQKISVLLPGGDDQMENQTTSNIIPVEFGKKEGQVLVEGNKAKIDDSGEDENTQGDNLYQTTAQKISVLLTGGDNQTENQTTSKKIPLKRNRAQDYDQGKSDTSPASDDDDSFIKKKKKYSKKISQNKPKVKVRKENKQGKEGKKERRKERKKKDGKKTDENKKISPAVTRNKSRLYYCQIFIFIPLILSKYLRKPSTMSRAWLLVIGHWSLIIGIVRTQVPFRTL